MKASKEARTFARWREQAARLIAESMTEHWHAITRPIEVVQLAHGLLDGMHFDVALVRAYAERLIAEGERLERERLVFMDWTRERGEGPEDFDHVLLSDNPWLDSDLGRGGGWPGPLAREWGTVRCEACEGKGRQEVPREHVTAPLSLAASERVATHFEADGWSVARCEVEPGAWVLTCACAVIVRCKPCRGRGYVKHHGREAAAANGGAWMIRAGRRLLDTLDGRCPWALSAAKQASECQTPTCRGSGWSCAKCRGTGHNLSGTLPPVEYSPRVRRAYWEGIRNSTRNSAARNSSRLAEWQMSLASSLSAQRERDGSPIPMTRVVPRGEHRDRFNGADGSVRVNDGAEADARIEARWMRLHQGDRLPRWRLGELRHSEQRRERERRRTDRVARLRRDVGQIVEDAIDAATFNYAAIVERHRGRALSRE